MKTAGLTLLSLIVCIMLIVGCEENQVLPQQEVPLVSLDAPNYVDASLNPGLNGLNFGVVKDENQTIHLGRILFFDKALSAGNTVACGSCHRQEFAFSDPFRHSTGIASQLSERNTPTIVNSAFGSGLFWDQRSAHLMDLVARPIANHREMGFSNMDELLAKLNERSYYPELFERAFGSEEITLDRLSTALALFSSKLNSFDSDLDQVNRGEHELNALELRGMQLFVDNGCNSCHTVMNRGLPIGSDIIANGSGGYTGSGRMGEVANIGLDQVYQDNGVGAMTGLAEDNGQFKIPSLRNIAITPPYMHDGRFATLRDVLTFYSDQIRPHPNLDFRLRNSNGSPVRMHLTETDKEAIIAFLHTLTSKDLLTNPLFSNPFE